MAREFRSGEAFAIHDITFTFVKSGNMTNIDNHSEYSRSCLHKLYSHSIAYTRPTVIAVKLS